MNNFLDLTVDRNLFWSCSRLWNQKNVYYC